MAIYTDSVVILCMALVATAVHVIGQWLSILCPQGLLLRLKHHEAATIDSIRSAGDSNCGQKQWL